MLFFFFFVYFISFYIVRGPLVSARPGQARPGQAWPCHTRGSTSASQPVSQHQHHLTRRADVMVCHGLDIMLCAEAGLRSPAPYLAVPRSYVLCAVAVCTRMDRRIAGLIEWNIYWRPDQCAVAKPNPRPVRTKRSVCCFTICVVCFFLLFAFAALASWLSFDSHGRLNIRIIYYLLYVFVCACL